uniref:Uncharacterized protein n=1 Tax=Cyprinus carpio TaxID=7962 RepID=A0A8C1QT03_CYPCA
MTAFVLQGHICCNSMDPVEVFAAGEKGRGLRVTKEMSAGEVVFAEASFAAVVLDRYLLRHGFLSEGILNLHRL